MFVKNKNAVSVESVVLEGYIEVVAQEHNLYSPTSIHNHKLFLFTKDIGAFGPYLYRAVTAGQTLRFAEFNGYKINNAGQQETYFNTHLENAEANPERYDIKDPLNEEHNHLEHIELFFRKNHLNIQRRQHHPFR